MGNDLLEMALEIKKGMDSIPNLEYMTLDNVDFSEMGDWYFLSDFLQFPRVAGVYFIYCECCDRPLYIGRTGNIYERFKGGHHIYPYIYKEPHIGVTLYFIPIYLRRHVMGYIETSFINQANPIYNNRKGGDANQ